MNDPNMPQHNAASAANKGSFLDSRPSMDELDAQHALSSIEMMGSQVQQMWAAAQKLEVPAEYQRIKNVVVAGMGGSILGTHVIQTLFKDELKLPIFIAPDYEVPAFVNHETLVIASSYSGTTEETLAAVADAQKKGALLAGITSGGKLAEFLRMAHAPALIFDATFNPSNSPRMGLGYSIFGQIALCAKLGVISLTEADYQSVLETIAAQHLLLSASVPQAQNTAKLLSFELIDRLPVITVAEHLEGMAHVFANQLNENAKTFAEFRTVPEMNHHLLEGLQFPQSNSSNLFFVMGLSDLYGTSNQKRMKLTGEILAQNHLESTAITLKTKTKLAQAFEFLVMAAYTSFYLAMLNNQNPIPNPWVDWLKSELKK